jgi:hypothetical protein
MDQLRKNIMRRVYYTFALKTALSPALLHGLILCASFYVLTLVVSVPDVWANLMQVPVGNVFTFFLGALKHTQTVTLVLLAVMSLTLFSILRRIVMMRQVMLEVDRGRMV